MDIKDFLENIVYRLQASIGAIEHEQCYRVKEWLKQDIEVIKGYIHENAKEANNDLDTGLDDRATTSNKQA